jgi:hypothetical protein
VSYLRSRSDRDRDRPAELTPRQKLERLTRTYRIPEGVSLDAILEGVPEAEIRERGKCFPPALIVEDAVNVYLVAFDTLRRAGEALRAAIRGCTLEFVCLASLQTLAAASKLDKMSKEDAKRAAAAEAAQAQLRDKFTTALSLREQARRILGSMCRDDAVFQDQVMLAASGSNGNGSASMAMLSLAAVGHQVLTKNDAKVQQRAKLLGLDYAYVDSLEDMGLELQRLEREVEELLSGHGAEEESLAMEGGRILFVMMHVVEVFAAAHELEKQVPLLRPVNTARFMPSMSKIPPPPPPGRKSKGKVKTNPPKTAPKSISGDGLNFRGGLGTKSK